MKLALNRVGKRGGFDGQESHSFDASPPTEDKRLAGSQTGIMGSSLENQEGHNSAKFGTFTNSNLPQTLGPVVCISARGHVRRRRGTQVSGAEELGSKSRGMRAK